MQPDLKEASKLTIQIGLFLSGGWHSILDSQRKGKAAPDGRPHTGCSPTPLIYSDATGLITIKDPGRLQYVLDGQQRLTAIYALFCRERQLDPTLDKYKIDPAIFNISFDLDDKRFVPDEELNSSHTNLKLSTLFNSEEFHDIIQGFSKLHIRAAVGLQSQFQNYEVPVVVTSKTSREDIGIIFERINNTATKLSTLDLMVAWTWSDDFHLKEQLDDILGVLDQKEETQTQTT